MIQFNPLKKASKFFIFTCFILVTINTNLKAQIPLNTGTASTQNNFPNRGCGTGLLPAQFETWVQSLNPASLRLGGGQAQSVFNIPVVVHVIHNNEAINSATATTGGNLNAAQIQDQINILNQDFNGLNPDTSLIPAAFKPFMGKFQFNFCLAVVNPTGGIMAEPGIDRISRTAFTWTAPPYSSSYISNTIKPATIWNTSKYMNIWVCNISGGLLGFATFPNPGTSGLSGLSGFGNTSTDGVVMHNFAFGSVGTAVTNSPYHKGRTATHEIGHWLGLIHIWGDNGQCGGTDYCNDTPPQRGGSAGTAGANFGCPTYPHNANTCTISGQANPNGDMFMNYMDYTNDACMYMFTNDQKTRAQLIMTNSPMRLALLTSTVCNAPTAINDLGILYISHPTFSQNITCSTSINPSVMLYNFGTNTITSATFSYNINGVGTQTVGWTGVIAPSNSLNVAMPTMSGLTNGNKVYNVGAYLPNGTTDPNMNNNISNQPFSIAAALNYSISPNATVCQGNTVAISLNSASNYTYTLQPGNTTTSGTSANFVVNPTITTIYTLSISNGTTCTVTQNYTAFVNTIGSLSVTSNQTVCSGASATLQASGLSSYTWNTGANTSAIAVTPSISTIYTVTGTLGPCVYSNTVGVTVGNLAININSLSLCPGNSGSLSASGASNYTWSNGSNNQSILVSPSVTTTYSVFGTNGSCSGTATRVVTILPTPTITGVPSTTSICSGMVFIFNPSGACSYTYSGGTNTVSPSVSSNYTVIGSDCTTGCLGSCTMSLIVNPTPTITTIVNPTNICVGSTCTLTASGASSYTWVPAGSGPMMTDTPTITTTYTVIGFNGSCSNSTTATVIVTPIPTITINNYTICSGGSATLTPSGASSYTWSTGSNLSSIIVSPLVNTVYTVSGSNSNCTSTQTVSVDIGSALSIAINSPSFICAGSSATLNASGATSYTWSNNSNNAFIVVNPTITTTYSVNGTNGSCAGNAIQTISVNPVPLVSVISSPTTAICPGGSATLVASGATTYSWSNGGSGSQIVVSPTANAVYSVSGSSNGCNNSATVVVNTGGTAITLTLTTNANNICAGSQATLNAIGATNYSWNTGSTTSSIVVSPTITSTYSVVGSNGACQGNSSLIINVIPVSPINVNASPSFSVCLGQSVLLSASGPFTNYIWSNTGSNASSISITPSATTNYTISALANSVSCASQTVIAVIVNPNPVTSLSITSASCGNGCNGKLNVFSNGGTSPYTYSLSGSSCTTMPCTNLCAGLYTLKTTDSVGCSNSNIFSISNSLNNLIATINATHATCAACNNGALSVSPVGGTSPYTYTWAPNGGNAATANNLTTGCYTVTVRDTAGCVTKSWACVGIGTGIDGKVIYQNELLLFPNPTKDLLNIQLEGFIFNYKVYSSLGQLIANENNISNQATINIDTFAKGIYVIEVSVGDAIIRKKIMKE